VVCHQGTRSCFTKMVVENRPAEAPAPHKSEPQEISQ